MFALPVLVAALAGQSTVTLHFEPPVGKVYKFRMKMKMSQNLPGSPKAIVTGSTSDLDMKILSRTAGVTTMEARVVDMKSALPPGMPATNMEAVQKMMKKPVQIKTDRQFNMVGMSGGMLGSAASMPGGLGTLVVPAHPLRIGETWSNELDLGKLMGAMGGAAATGVKGKIPMKFKLEGIEGSVPHALARIGIVIAGRIPLTIQGQTMLLNVSGQGFAKLDVSTGMSMSTSMTMFDDISISGQTMKQKIIQSMDVR